MIIPLSEMLYQRRHEISLLKALGYTQKRITKILWRESTPVVLVSSIIGVLAGIFYTALVMWLLGTVWKGATHTEGFSVYSSITTILIGFPVGIILSLTFLRIIIKRNIHFKSKNILPQRRKGKTKSSQIFSIVATALTIIIIGINFFFLHSVILFVIAGITLLVTASICGDYMICKNGSISNKEFNNKKLVWSAIFANRKQAVLSFFALSIGIFIVFSVGLNRKGFADGSQLQTGTGGFRFGAKAACLFFTI